MSFSQLWPQSHQLLERGSGVSELSGFVVSQREVIPPLRVISIPLNRSFQYFDRLRIIALPESINSLLRGVFGRLLAGNGSAERGRKKQNYGEEYPHFKVHGVNPYATP